jgi:hypothetical protein
MSWLEPLQLDSGAHLGPITLAYETYGKLSPARDNAILLLHALSGDAHAAGWHANAAKPGPQERTVVGFEIPNPPTANSATPFGANNPWSEETKKIFNGDFYYLMPAPNDALDLLMVELTPFSPHTIEPIDKHLWFLRKK